jgi:hypothetical protein
MDLTFISLLRFFEMRAVVFVSNSLQCVPFKTAFSASVAIERGCSIGAIHDQNRQQTT